MNAVSCIERLLVSGVLVSELTTVPDHGVADTDLARLDEELPRPLSAMHREILRRWDGIDLELLQLYGFGSVAGVRSLRESQGSLPSGVGGFVIGSDPAGFIYLEFDSGEIASYDTDGGALSILAANLDDFICRVVAGPEAASFGGEEWLAALEGAGLVAPQKQSGESKGAQNGENKGA